MYDDNGIELFQPGDLIEFTFENELYAFSNVLSVAHRVERGVVIKQQEINKMILLVYWFHLKIIKPLLLTNTDAAFMSYTVLGYVKKLDFGLNNPVLAI